MPVPPPPGALTAAFRTLCMRCVRRKAKVGAGEPAHDCVWSASSSKCNHCVGQKANCVPMAWFLADEYQAIVDAETSTNPDPAAAKAAAAEAVRVANLTAANMPKFRSPAEASAYMESMALRNAVEDGLRRVRQAVTAVGRDTAALLEGQGSLLEGLESSLKGVGKSVVAAVDKVSVAVAAGPRGQKRKRGEEDGDEAAEGTFSAPIG